MIRLVGRYQVEAGTIEDFEPVIDRMMEALLADDTVIEPDLAVDLEAGSLEVYMLIDTDDAWAAGQIASSAIGKAFSAADLDVPDPTRVFAHKDLLKQSPVSIEASLVAAG
ncbi:MAG TPA: hypothetical protein VHU85_08395 [Acidimicrobiales bacterium]|nr:hypothetical protein [Acidimicrobiales bacterium]